MPCGKQRQPDSRAVSEVVDALKGAALIATFIGFLSIFATWVLLWENVWRVSVEPVRGAIYDARLNRPGAFSLPSLSWMGWRIAGP